MAIMAFNKRLTKLYLKLRAKKKYAIWAPPQGTVLPNFIVVYDSRDPLAGVWQQLQDALDATLDPPIV